MGTCYCTVGGGRRQMLTRLRPEPVLVPAFRGLVNRTYSARDTMTSCAPRGGVVVVVNVRGTRGDHLLCVCGLLVAAVAVPLRRL